MKQSFSNFTEIILTNKNHFVDYVATAFISASMINFLEGIFKVLGYLLTLALLFRAYYGIKKDKLEVKSKEIEIKLKQKELDNETNF